MFKNSQKISISKHFIISLLFVVLIFTSVGVNVDSVCAHDSNQSVDGITSELNIEDKLENSQENILDTNVEIDESLSVSQDSEVLGAVITPEKHTFESIRKAVESANDGDTIKLSGTYYAQKESDEINFNKNLKVTADSTAILNAKGLTRIFTVSNSGAGSSFNNLKFLNAYHEGSGGGIFINTKNVKVTNCIFENGKAYQGSGIGTVYNNYTAVNLLIENCKFINNYAQKTAAAISAYGNNTRLINCTFDSNKVYNGSSVVFGGAIQIGLDDYDSYGYIYGCKFYNNYVNPENERSHGGAGCIRDGIIYENCLFVNNSAAQGGALTYHGSGVIKNCTFINNTAYYYGGALSNGFNYIAGDLKIENCSFEGNDAPIGGAVQLLSQNIIIDKCNFNSNNASKNGGAININAETVNVANSNFNENIANVDGGAVFINGKSTSIKNSLFKYNEAIPDFDKLDDGLGGAIYINSTQAFIENNEFYFNTARNGSAIYYDKYGNQLRLSHNTLYQNQAWVYALPIYARDIYYGETEIVGSIIHGGNNIAKYGNLEVSNAIYNAASNNLIEIDGETPVSGATTSGHLYQDDREYNMNILLTVVHEDGTVVYNRTLNSDTFGEVKVNLNNLKVGKYYVTAKHHEDTYYKAITNTTSFRVIAQVDIGVKKSVSTDPINYYDNVVWTLNITNAGPSNATGVIVKDVLPNGLEWIEDNTNGKYNPKTGILRLDSLNVGEVYIVKIMTKVKKSGLIINNVNITANEHDSNLTNNHDQSNVTVNPACDLVVIKSVNVSNVNLHDSVKWTITVSNNGPNTATGVVVSDLLPKSLIWISDDSSGKYNHNTGKWDVGKLNKGSNTRLNIVCKVNATGIIENKVSVTGNEYDWNKSNNNASETVNVNSTSDLGIVKSVNHGVVNYTDVVCWTLTVTNYGPDAASGVKIYDTLPRGFVYINSTKPYSNGVIDIGNLAVGGSVSVKIYSRANVTGSFVNVASVKGNVIDQNLANDKANASILVKPAADLQVTKTVNNTSPDLGETIEWTITVKNNGPNTATGVTVSDMLPKSLTFLRSTGNYNNNAGKWNIGTLNKGSSATLKIICSVNATGVTQNKASVTGNEYDWDKSNNNATETINVDKASDLGIVKSVSLGVVNYSDVVCWILTVTNYGSDAASGVKIYDALPKGFVYINSTKPYSNGVINIGNLAADGSVSVKIYTIANITGSFVNVASVKGNEFDQNPANNEANVSVLVKPAADLQVTKSANVSAVNFYDLVKWTITVRNNGPDDATGVVVSDLLPKSLIWIGDDSSGKYNRNTGKWNVGTLKKGSSVGLNIVCKVNATGSIKNLVSVTGNEFDFDKSNNNASKTVRVNPASDLAIVKSVNHAVVNYSDVVCWILTVTNYGPDAASGVKIYDTLPNGFVYVNSTKTYSNGVIDMGNLAVGSSVSVKIHTIANITGSFVNVASVKGNEFDQNPANNEANVSVLVKPAADLQVTKSVNVSVVNLHDLVKWTITVSNNGPDVATGVVVSDLLPKSLIWVSDDSSGKYNRNTGKWNVGTLNKGNSVRLNIVCKVNVTGSIKNIVSVTGNEFDFDKSNNNASKIINVAKASDLGIVKSVSPGVVNYSDVVCWILTVTNYGSDAASGVKIYDTLPNGFVYINSTKPFSNGVINIGNLAVGGTVSVKIYTRANITGSFVNVATVKGNEFDQNLSNNKANVSVLVIPAADLQVTKTSNVSVVNLHDLVKWTITVKNNGPDVATGVIVKDLLPKSLIWVSDDSSGKYDHKTGKWNVGTLNNASTIKLNVISKVNATGSIKNLVSVTGNEFDFDKSNNNASKIINVAKASDLGIVKSVSQSVVNYSDVICWTLTVTNYGPDAASGVKIYDTLPNGFVYVNSTKPYSNGVIDIGNLAVGGTVSVKIHTRANITGSFVNVATVNGNEFDQNPSNNKAKVSVLVNPAADLQVIKSVNDSNPNFTDEIRWTITVRNNGPDAATGVIVKDMLPESLVWMGDDSSGKYNHDSGIWNVGNINNGEKKTLTITVKVNGTGLFVNNVSVTGNEFDWDKSNNEDNESIDVANASDLSVIKLVNQSEVQYHQLVKWTIIAKNNGPDKATGVLVEDILPEGLQLINYTAIKGFYDKGLWSLCCLEKGESQTLELTCFVNKTGKLTNIVTISGDEFDPNLSNNENNASVLVPKSSDLSIVKNVNDTNPFFDDMIEWSITITNNGPDDCDDVVVIDELPEGLEFVEYTCTSGSYGDGMWHLDHLNNGDSESLTIRSIVKTLLDTENIANVVPSQYDWNESNNKDNASITVNPLADLAIVKLVNTSCANYLDLVKWTLIVTNYGPNEATEVVVSDVIPEGLTVVDFYGDDIYGDSVWDIGYLDCGESKQLDIVCRIEKTGDFTNVASVWAYETDPDLENNEDENYLFVYPASDISITKTVPKYKYSVGDVVSYSIKLTNNGPDVAKNVKVREIMDDSLELLSFQVSAGDFDKVNDVWSLDLLDSGRSAILKIKALAIKAGIAENNVVATNDNYDPDLSNNNDSVSVDILEKEKHNNPPKNSKQKQSDDEIRDYAQSILEKYESGNPIMVLILLFVFTMGALYGNTIFKKR